MLKYVALISLLAHQNVFSQHIPFDRLINLINQRFSTVSDYLQETGWDYSGIDTFGKKNYPGKITTTWVYRYKDADSVGTVWLDCQKVISSDLVVDIVYVLKDKKEYTYYLEKLNMSSFKHIKTTEDEKGISNMYFKNNLFFHLSSSLDEHDGNIYSLEMDYDTGQN